MSQQTIIDANTPPLAHQFKSFWAYRELFWMLAYRDFRVKYAQAALGVLWALLNPLVSVILLSFVFHKVANVDTANCPPLLFTLAGIAIWSYFSEVFSNGSDAILSSQQMVKKVYFPRIVLPASKALSGIVEWCVTLALLLIGCIFYHQHISLNILFAPIFLFLNAICALTGGIWLSALSIRFRDFKYITPVLLRIGLFVTPIAYSADQVPDQYLTLFYLNPLSGIIEGFRWSVLGTPRPPLDLLGVSFLMVFIFFFIGIIFFNKVEGTIADIV